MAWTEKLYRYDSSRVATGSISDDYESLRPGYRISVDLHSFTVLSRTPKGAWVNYGGGKKWVHTTSKRPWAWPTENAALESFITRKKNHIGYLKRDLEDMRDAWKQAVSLDIHTQEATA